MTDLTGSPMGETIREGLDDLSRGREDAAALLVGIASRRLRHGRYNALLRELVSFERVLEGRHRRVTAAA